MEKHICITFAEVERYINMDDSSLSADDWFFISDIAGRLENCEKCSDSLTRYIAAKRFYNMSVIIPNSEHDLSFISFVRENLEKARAYGDNFVAALEKWLAGTIDTLKTGGELQSMSAASPRAVSTENEVMMFENGEEYFFENGEEYFFETLCSGKIIFIIKNAGGIESACLVIRAVNSDFISFYKLEPERDELVAEIKIPQNGRYEAYVIPLN